jgi:hypothetical protein
MRTARLERTPLAPAESDELPGVPAAGDCVGWVGEWGLLKVPGMASVKAMDPVFSGEERCVMRMR